MSDRFVPHAYPQLAHSEKPKPRVPSPFLPFVMSPLEQFWAFSCGRLLEVPFYGAQPFAVCAAYPSKIRCGCWSSSSRQLRSMLFRIEKSTEIILLWVASARLVPRSC